MKKHIIALIGHFALMALHYYLIEIKGITVSQFVTFTAAHWIWYDLIINRIYGLK